MALEFICSRIIVERKKIALPRESLNGKIIIYKIDREKREIEFFYASSNGDDDLDFTGVVPKGAREMEFSIYRKHGQNILGAPVFYDGKEEILKIGNR